MKVLILSPSFERQGGVANHFKGLKDKFRLDVEFFFTGNIKQYKFPKILFYALKNYLTFIIKLINNDYDVIHVNPSLKYDALIRDMLFLVIIKLFKKKCLLFIHGWNTEVEKDIEKKYKNVVRKFLNKSDLICVLGSEFKRKLINWGIITRIELATTKVDDNLINDFNIDHKEINKNILFLARIEKEKGIEIAINAFEKIVLLHPDSYLYIVGEGSYLKYCKSITSKKEIQNIRYYGHLEGHELKKVIEKCSIYLFPTFYGEGMPTSLLEAMAFGLVILTRPVGGIKDFFTKEMGYLTESLEPCDFSKSIIGYFENVEETKKIMEFNHKYATQKFLASRVALHLEQMYSKVLHIG